MTKGFGRGLLIGIGLALVTLSLKASQVSASAEVVGVLTEVIGTVTLNGQPAATGDVVLSGSSLETEANSSAVVSLAKLGRVEALPDTTMNLRYDRSSILVVLDAGSVRVTPKHNVDAIVTRGN